MSEYYGDDEDNLVLDRPPTEERQELKPPPKYMVVMLNDDFTPMDFVVELLMSDFNRGFEEASRVMMEIHSKGKGIAGIYPRDIAETKALIANHKAQANEHPLKCEVEQASE